MPNISNLTTIQDATIVFTLSLAERFSESSRRADAQHPRDVETRQLLHTFDADAVQLERIENMLRIARLGIEDHAMKLRQRCSPVTMLPHEVLTEIFAFAIEHDHQDSMLLVNIMCVNKAWRGIALRETGLWTRIHAIWPRAQRAVYLIRSGQRPIDVYVWSVWEAGPVNADGDDTLMVDSRKDLLVQSSRWRSLSLMHCAPAFTSHFVKAVMRLGNLEQLETFSIAGRIDGPSFTVSDFKSALPALRSLRVWGPCLENIELVGRHLLDLAVDPPLYTPRIWGSIFGSCTALESLTISSDYNRPDRGLLPSPSPLYDLPRLHTLSLGSERDRTDVETMRLILTK